MYKPFTKLCCFVLSAILLLNMLPLQSFAAQIGSITDSTTAALPEDSAELSASVVEAMELADRRTAFTKDFRLSDGLSLAVTYPEAVHYQKGDSWAEIDNTLIRHADGTYRNTAGVWNVKLPQSLDGTRDVSVTKDGYTLSFRMTGALESSNLQTRGTAVMQHRDVSASQALLQQVDLTEELENAPFPQTVPEKNYARIQYSKVLSGTSVQYDLQGNTVKESVILDSYSATLQGYRFVLNTGNLIPVLEEDNSISLYDEKQVNIIMTMPAPFLVDNSGIRNDDVRVTLTGKDGAYTLCYLLPTDWLAAEDREWPVVLDPIVKAEMDEDNILDCTVTPTKTYPNTHNILECGYDSNNGGIHRSLLQYAELPELRESETVVKAELQLGLLTGYSDDFIVQAHKMNDTWTVSNATWATAQNYNHNVEDYVVADKTYTAFVLEITDIVRDWYAGSNTGLLLRASDAMESGSRQNWMQFMSSDYSVSSGGPTLYVYYRHNSGIESYYTYQTMGAGKAGAAYVADATGQLKVVNSVASYASGINPFQLNLVYNSDYFAQGENKEDKVQSRNGIYMFFGNGFTMDIIQSIKPPDIQEENQVVEYLVWHDGDGTDHYFHKDGSKYKDEDGLGLTIEKSGSNYTMTDDKGNKWYFENGLYKYYQDESGNKIVVNWEGSGSSRYFRTISQINKGQTDDNKTTLVTVDFVAGSKYDNYVSTVTDAAGRVLHFTYDEHDRLTGLSLSESAGAAAMPLATYTYASPSETDSNYSNRIAQMKDEMTGYSLQFGYSNGKVSSIQEQLSATKIGARMDVTYRNNTTTYRDYGVDREEDTADDLYTEYVFDYWGRTVNACSRDASGKILGITNQVLSGSGDTGTALRKNNRVLQTASMGTAAENLLGNHSFESDLSGWYISGSDNATGVTVTTQHRTGNRAFRGQLDSQGTLGVHTSVELTANITYTLSCYVNTAEVETFGDGVRLLVNGQGYSWESTRLKRVTSGESDAWERISVTFAPVQKGTYTLMLQGLNLKGKFYADDFQLEQAEAPSNYNMVQNGSLIRGNEGWHFTEGDCFDDGYPVWKHNGDGNKLLRLNGSPTKDTCAWQTVKVNAPSSQTYVLSGLAWANSVPDNKDTKDEDKHAEDTTKRFGLQAIVHYVPSDATSEPDTEYHYAPFNPDVNDWQFTSLTIVPKQADRTVDNIQIVCAYEKNANEAWFDNICLVKEAAQTMRYDSEGKLIGVTTSGLKDETATYNNGNLLSAYTGASGTYNYTYDTTYKHRLTAVTEDALKQTYTYDNFGNVVGTKLTKKDGSGDSLTTSGTYTNNGNLLYTSTDANGSQVWNYYSDALSKMSGAATRVCTAPAGTTDNSDDGVSWQYTYSTYDMLMRPTQIQLDRLAMVQYNYDNKGNLSAVVRKELLDNEGQVSVAKTQTYGFTYDDWGNRTKVSVGADAATSRTLSTWTYAQASGLLEAQIYGNNDKVEYTYDSLGRTKTVIYKDANETVTRTLSYIYTGDGQLYSIQDSATGKTTQYTYDTLGRLIRTQDGDVLSKATYNSFNQLTRWGYTSKLDNAYETYTYDTTKDNSISDGTLTGMRMVNGDTVAYTYDALQRLTRKELNSGKEGGGIREEYTYSGTRVTQKTNWKGGTKTHELAYTYDTLGNILTEADTVNSTSVTYSYDRMGQLTGAVHSSGRVESYTYDNAGNILTFNNGTKSHTLAYDNAQWTDLLTAVDGEEITYDAIGNPLSYYDGYRYTFTWTEGRRLASSTYGGQTHRYQYDANGLRTKKINPNGSYIEYYIVDGRYLGEIHYTAANAVDLYIRYNYDESGSVVGISLWNAGISNAWEDYYFVKNLQGDVLKVYRESDHAEAASYSYDSWGNILTTTGDLNFDGRAIKDLNPFRYRTYYYDNETWFYYLQSRYYDPAIGRFVNADGIDQLGANGDVASLNLFAYCGNNPAVRVDSKGKAWNIAIGALVGAAAGLVGQVVSDVVTSFLNGQVCISNWQTYTGAVVGGVAGGVVLAMTGNVAAANIITGAVTTGIGQTLEKWTIKNYDKSWAEIGVNAVADGAISYGLGKLPGINGATAGRNNWSAVYKSGLTKLRNGTAKTMSTQVVIKGVKSSIVSGFALDGYYGAKQSLYGKMKNLFKRIG